MTRLIIFPLFAAVFAIIDLLGNGAGSAGFQVLSIIAFVLFCFVLLSGTTKNKTEKLQGVGESND